MWLLFTFITILAWGFAEIFYKRGNQAHEKYAHLKTTIFVGIIMGIHATIVLLTQDLGFKAINILIYLPVSLCYLVSMTCSYFGVRFIEESISDPIENTSGAIVPILCAIILHESIQAWSIVAIVLIAIGVLGVGFLENNGKTDRKKKLGKTLAIWAFAMPFCYALLDATGTFLDIYYLDMETTLLQGVTEDTIENVANTCYEYTFLIVAVGLLVFLAIKKVRLFSMDNEVSVTKKLAIPNNEENIEEAIAEASEAKEENEVVAEVLPTKEKLWQRVLGQKFKIIAALLETVGQFTYIFALSGDGAIAAPMIGGGCVLVSVLLSRVLLKEKLNWKQYCFVVLILTGLVILSIVEGD